MAPHNKTSILLALPSVTYCLRNSFGNITVLCFYSLNSLNLKICSFSPATFVSDAVSCVSDRLPLTRPPARVSFTMDERQLCDRARKNHLNGLKQCSTLQLRYITEFQRTARFLLRLFLSCVQHFSSRIYDWFRN